MGDTVTPLRCALAVVKVASRCNLNCTYCYVYNLGDTFTATFVGPDSALGLRPLSTHAGPNTMSDKVDGGFGPLENAIEINRIQTRIAALKGEVIRGRSLTAAEKTELADLELRLSKLARKG